MGKVVLDASLLIGVLDKSDAHHHSACQAVVAHRAYGFNVPASVLAEILVRAARQSSAKVEEIRSHVRLLFGPIRAIDDDVAVTSAQLCARHKALRLQDALVIATGIVDDAEVILTADARWRGIDNRVQLLKTVG
ncbi:MAG TPA: PIN domain-containing protein [Mycobacteriales bacterium]|nr:PIN domain-containing protein [Mycobacteriales bacterium]